MEDSNTDMEMLDPYGLLDSDNEKDFSATEYDEPYYMISETNLSLSPSSGNQTAKQEMMAQERLGHHWSTILGLEDDTPVKPEDSFFDLGGTSVAALKLGAATRSDGLMLTVPDVFRNPTLSEMAKAIQLQSDNVNNLDHEVTAFSLIVGTGSIDEVRLEAERQCGISQGMIEDIYPCTPLQKGMMALSVLKPGVYVEQHVYALPASWNVTAFQSAWQMMTESNPVLRTRIIQTDQYGWVQILDRGATEWATAKSLETYLNEDRVKPMDFGDPLVRCALINNATDGLIRFVLTLHHAIQDGWSMNLLPKKISEAYKGLSGSPEIKFNKFIRYVEELDLQASKNYWTSELAGSNPSNFPRLPSTTYEPLATRRIRHSLSLPKGLPPNITLSTMIRAVWSIICARYVDSSDVTVGVTMSGRSIPVSGITEMFGPTIVTMPVRVRLCSTQKVRNFLETIQRQATEMIPHEQYGLQNIQSINQDTCVACNFQNLLIVQPMLEPSSNDGDTNSLYEIPMDFPNYLNYALTVECVLTVQGVRVEIGFDEAVIDERQVERVLRQFEHVLSQLHESSNWEKCLQEIELISPADKEEIMQWNSESPTVLHVCVHRLIEQETLRHPNSPAICAWDGYATYARLNDLATKLAGLLVRDGIGPEVFVPVCFEKSFWTVVAMLAVMKAGGAFVLLDPSQPTNRLRQIITTVQAKAALVSPRQFKVLSSIVEKAVVVEPSIFDSLLIDSRLLEVKVESNNALYVTFTSGSTGEPKGVVTEHFSCASAFQAQIKAKYFRRSSRVLQFASHSFDTCIEEILATLMAGGCVCVPSEEERLIDLNGAISRLGVNVAELTTSVASLLAPESIPGLKVLRQGGEPMTTALLDRWVCCLHLENSYGPSECCVTTTIQKLTPNVDPTNIGKGLGCLLWIAEFSDYTRLAPVGTVGELLIQGPNVARGYINQDPNAVNPFVEEPLLPCNLDKDSRRLFKTGDVARYNTDGTVSILGRKDTQIKLRGQRVELDEIEYHLGAGDAVARSVVLAPKVGPFRDGLVAVTQLRDWPGKSEAPHDSLRSIKISDYPGLGDQVYSIRRYLETRLPSHMVPTMWLAVNHIPFSVTGKSDRKAVSKWLESMSSKEKLAVQATAFPSLMPTALASSESTALTLSSKLADLVAHGDETLRSNVKGKDTLLHSIGINSIDVVTLASFIKQSFHITLSIDILTKSSLTVRELAKHVDDAKAGIFDAEYLTRVDLARELSELQQTLFHIVRNSRYQLPTSDDEIETIFVTGVTGYLGTHILRTALVHPQLRRVIALVRAKSIDHGLQRVINSAKMAGWWTDDLQSKLEIWIGDLGDTHLGLTKVQWEELNGVSPTNTKIDAIIHNGAAVNWYRDYAALKSSNVASTLDLLSATASSPFIQRFTYVSGGPHWDGEKSDDSDEDLMKQIENSNGYGQTKIISELLAKYLARSSERNRKRVSILKPGYIIGTPSEGIANIDDFLWRLVAGAVGIEAVSKEDADLWIFVATVDSVANRVLSNLLRKEKDSHVLLAKVLDGLTVGDLWSTLAAHFGYNLRPLGHDEWSAMLTKNVDSLRQKHPLWPVVHLIDQGYNSLGSSISATQRALNSIGKQRIQSAIVRNVDYLIRIGFLPDLKGERVASREEAAFTRNQQIL